MGSGQDGPVVDDGTTAALPVSVGVPAVQQGSDVGVVANVGSRPTHNPLWVLRDSYKIRRFELGIC